MSHGFERSKLVELERGLAMARKPGPEVWWPWGRHGIEVAFALTDSAALGWIPGIFEFFLMNFSTGKKIDFDVV